MIEVTFCTTFKTDAQISGIPARYHPRRLLRQTLRGPFINSFSPNPQHTHVQYVYTNTHPHTHPHTCNTIVTLMNTLQEVLPPDLCPTSSRSCSNLIFSEQQKPNFTLISVNAVSMRGICAATVLWNSGFRGILHGKGIGALSRCPTF